MDPILEFSPQELMLEVAKAKLSLSEDLVSFFCQFAWSRDAKFLDDRPVAELTVATTPMEILILTAPDHCEEEFNLSSVIERRPNGNQQTKSRRKFTK